jgi:hypothetical protein
MLDDYVKRGTRMHLPRRIASLACIYLHLLTRHFTGSAERETLGQEKRNSTRTHHRIFS